MYTTQDRGYRRMRLVLMAVGLMVTTYVLVLFLVPPQPRAVAQEVPGAAQETPGAALYVEHCSACHQASGQGVPGTFPPLADNETASDTAYVIKVISDGRTGAIVVSGENYDQEMPAVTAVNDEEAAMIADYVVALSTGTVGAVDEGPALELGGGDPERGHALFRGSTRFDQGGAACASCHIAGDVGNLGGTSLGPDLTDVYERFGGDAGLGAWLASPPSATMKPIFDDKPLNNEELAHLVAFLGDAPERDEPAGAVDWLTIYAVVGLAALLAGMAVAWRGMRQTYTQKLKPRSMR
jgi:ubiquinol-cytochrome c reductase cytochrome c subunit